MENCCSSMSFKFYGFSCAQGERVGILVNFTDTLVHFGGTPGMRLSSPAEAKLTVIPPEKPQNLNKDGNALVTVRGFSIVIIIIVIIIIIVAIVLFLLVILIIINIILVIVPLIPKPSQ